MAPPGRRPSNGDVRSPGGLGTFEGTSVALLHLSGVGVEAALTATLLLRAFTFWLPMVPGVIIARREVHGRGTRVPAGSASDVTSGSPATTMNDAHSHS